MNKGVNVCEIYSAIKSNRLNF